jgi:hypothetical protein
MQNNNKFRWSCFVCTPVLLLFGCGWSVVSFVLAITGERMTNNEAMYWQGRMDEDAIWQTRMTRLIYASHAALMQFEHNGDEAEEDRSVLNELQCALRRFGDLGHSYPIEQSVPGCGVCWVSAQPF